MIEAEPMTEYRYTVLFEPAEEGGFVVTCPALPGLVTEGDTLEEARAMAEDAIRGYIESLRKDHLPIPSDKARKRRIRVMVRRNRGLASDALTFGTIGTSSVGRFVGDRTGGLTRLTSSPNFSNYPATASSA